MKVAFKLTELEALADRLGVLTPSGFSVGAINQVLDSTYDLLRTTMLSGINLTDEYLQRSMQVERATESKPEASITTFGGKPYLTNLSHYGAMQETRAVNWTNEAIQAAGHKLGNWPGWTRRKGNQPLGIEPNRKAAGKSVEVVRGRRKSMKPVFSIPGKKDKEGNLILFSRNEADKVQAKTGPSPYQLARHAIPLIYDNVADDLREAVIDAAEREFTKALK